MPTCQRGSLPGPWREGPQPHQGLRCACCSWRPSGCTPPSPCPCQPCRRAEAGHRICLQLPACGSHMAGRCLQHAAGCHSRAGQLPAQVQDQLSCSDRTGPAVAQTAVQQETTADAQAKCGNSSLLAGLCAPAHALVGKHALVRLQLHVLALALVPVEPALPAGHAVLQVCKVFARPSPGVPSSWQARQSRAAVHLPSLAPPGNQTCRVSCLAGTHFMCGHGSDAWSSGGARPACQLHGRASVARTPGHPQAGPGWQPAGLAARAPGRALHSPRWPRWCPAAAHPDRSPGPCQRNRGHVRLHAPAARQQLDSRTAGQHALSMERTQLVGSSEIHLKRGPALSCSRWLYAACAAALARPWPPEPVRAGARLSAGCPVYQGSCLQQEGQQAAVLGCLLPTAKQAWAAAEGWLCLLMGPRCGPCWMPANCVQHGRVCLACLQLGRGLHRCLLTLALSPGLTAPAPLHLG